MLLDLNYQFEIMNFFIFYFQIGIRKLATDVWETIIKPQSFFPIKIASRTGFVRIEFTSISHQIN